MISSIYVCVGVGLTLGILWGRYSWLIAVFSIESLPKFFNLIVPKLLANILGYVVAMILFPLSFYYNQLIYDFIPANLLLIFNKSYFVGIIIGVLLLCLTDKRPRMCQTD